MTYNRQLTCIAFDIFCVDLVMGDIELFSSAIGVSRQLLWLASIGPLDTLIREWEAGVLVPRKQVRAFRGVSLLLVCPRGGGGEKKPDKAVWQSTERSQHKAGKLAALAAGLLTDCVFAPSVLDTDWQGVAGVWDKEGKSGSAEQQEALGGEAPFSHDNTELGGDALFLDSEVEPDNSSFFSSSQCFAAICLARFCRISFLAAISVVLLAMSLFLESECLSCAAYWSWRRTHFVFVKHESRIPGTSSWSLQEFESSSTLLWNNLKQVPGFCN